jgi:hypothetical protein
MSILAFVTDSLAIRYTLDRLGLGPQQQEKKSGPTCSCRRP